MKFAAIALVFTLAIAGTFAQTCTCNSVITSAFDGIVTLVKNLQTALQPLLTLLGPLGALVNVVINALIQVVIAVKGLLTTGGLTSITNLISQLGPIINQVLGALGISG